MPAAHEKRALRLILIVAFLTFAPSMANGFALDDVAFVQAVGVGGTPHPVVSGLKEPWWYFTQPYTAGTAKASFEYRPTTTLSFALVYNLISRPFLPVSAEALPHHIFNVLLHVLAVFMVWRWLRELGAGALVSLVTAGGFAVCGIHSEVVAGIVGRADPLGMVLGLFGLALFDRGRVWWAAVTMFLAFGTKESALAWAPFLCCHLLAKAWLAGEPLTLGQLMRTRGAALARALLPGLVLFFVLRQYVIADIAGYLPAYEQNPLAHVELGPRVITATALLGFGFSKCIVPFALASTYGPGALPVLTSPLAPGFLGAVAVLGTWLVLGLWLRRREPLLFLSATVFLGFSFIGSNIPVAVGTNFAERVYYVPSLGVCLLAAWLVQRQPEGSRARGMTIALMLALGALHAAVILARNGAWRDTATLLRADADALPSSADLQAKAGYTIMAEDPVRARTYFERAIAADPEHSGGWGNLAALQARAGDLEGAEQSLRRALACRHVAYSGSQPQLVEALIWTLRQRGKTDAAIEFCRDALAADPGHYYARLALLDLTYGRMATDAYGRLLEDAGRRHPHAPHFDLRRSLFAYETGRIAQPELPIVAQRWHSMLQNLPPAERAESAGIRARLYLGEVLANLGRGAEARGVLVELLRETVLTPAVRNRAEAALANAR